MSEIGPSQNEAVDPDNHWTWPKEVSEYHPVRPGRDIRIAPDGRRVWLLSDEAYDELIHLIDHGSILNEDPKSTDQNPA